MRPNWIGAGHSACERSEGGNVSVLATTLGAALLGVWLVESLIFAYYWRDLKRSENARPLKPVPMG
jgi:hypothetical protein